MEVLLKYFKNLTPAQLEQFGALGAVYSDWNTKINVISRKDIDELYLKHVLHSMAIAKVITFKPGTSIIDVGCGGGFPGIPLAILFPEVQFTLVDSIGKKIKVVNEVAASIGLNNVKGIHERAEKLGQKFDFVISRAVTAFPQFVELSKNLISGKQKNALPNGILYLKGGDFDDEIAPFRKKIEIFSIQTFFEEEFFETKKLIFLPL